MKTLEKNDIQGIIARGYSKLPHACYLLIEVTDAQKARPFIRHLADQVTSAAVSPDDKAMQIALTAAGLTALQVPQVVVGTFSRPFKEGMTDSHRQFILGDTGDHAPSNWEWGGPEQPQVHLMVMLFANEAAALEADYISLKEKLAHSGLQEIKKLDTHSLPGKEHFGFRDGISQPIVEGFSKSEAAGETFPAGEFILGYPNLYDQYGESPSISPDQDTHQTLATKANDPSQKDLGKNGSYLVFRQMSQDVHAFWQYQKDHASPHNRSGESQEEAAICLAAKMVGRWPSGAPLVTSPEKDDPTKANDNDFGYWEEDPKGMKCPYGAHIRRSQPRDWLLTEKTQIESKEMVSKHRLLRRGRPYGKPLAPSVKPEHLMQTPDDGEARGLHFICVVSELDRQFEFVQNAWVKFHKFGGLYDESDPLIGNHFQNGQMATDRFTVPAKPLRKVYKNLPQFTMLKGGAYFFLPGINALKYLME